MHAPRARRDSSRDGEDVGDVLGVIDARRFDIEANGPRILRVLQHDEQREIFERLGVAERQVLIVALAVLRVEVDMEKLSGFEAKLDVPKVIEPGDSRMRGLGIHAEERLHLLVEPADQVKHLANIREIHVGPRFVRLRLDGEI